MPRILGRQSFGTGDDVPSEATIADAIEGRRKTGQGEWMIRNDRHRSHDAEVARGTSQNCDKGSGIRFRSEDGVFEVRLHVATVSLGYHQRIFEHHEVEAGSLESLRHLDVSFPVPGISSGGEWRVPVIDRITAKPGKMKRLLGFHDTDARPQRSKASPKL